MKKKFFSFFTAIALTTGTIALSSQSPIDAVAAIPDYSMELPTCLPNTNAPGYSNKPCWEPNQSDPKSGQAHLNECSDSVTNFCYSLLVNGVAAPNELKATVSVGSWKTLTDDRDAGYEANIFLWRLPTGNKLSEESWGWGKRPKDQSGNSGKFDLTGLLDTSSEVSLTIKYKTASLPQFSVLIADSGEMKFSLDEQNLTLTLTGKPVRVALESSTQTINFDTEKNDDTTVAWSNRCGVPSMRFVVCNVDVADAQPLLFTARSKTFTNSPGADTPAPIWVNTNATYFHFPSVEVDPTTQAKSIQLKTAAPHLLPDGKLNKGNAAAFIPNGVLSNWGIEKTDATLTSALSSSIVKDGVATTVAATYNITDLGVKVFFPEVTYSAPIIKVGQAPKTTASPVAPTKPALAVKSLKRGKSKNLTSFIKLKGKGKATWKATGGCKIRSGKLVAPKKAATCKLTLTQKKYKKTPARKVSVTVRVR